MPYTDWSTTAANNTTIEGINIAEQCPPGNINNAIREVMAGVADLNDNLPVTTTLLPKDGGVFEGVQPTFTGEGALLHHASSSNASGKISILADGSPNPTSPSNGDMVFFYTP